MALDWPQCPAVESVPGKVSGVRVLRVQGCRYPPSLKVWKPAPISTTSLEWFDGLDREQVKAAIEFAARSRQKSAPMIAVRTVFVYTSIV